MSAAREHHLPVTRSARYFTLGDGATAREVWFVLHGYGQLAAYFIRHFQAIADGTRLIVAPEALSRFYLEEYHQRVGASWMTKEDRLHEIDDYLAYLDAVAHRLALPDDVPITVFGFSQGTATASRWATMGGLAPRRLILWAGGLPHDLDYAAYAPALRRMNLTLVLGSDDELITPESVAAQQALIDRHAIPYRLVRYEGGHQLHGETVRALAAESSP